MALWNMQGSLDETDIVKKIPITKFPFIIGRSKSIDMVILRSGISREHAEIISKDGRLFIRDLQSTNGTYVNKQRINTEVFLTHNTVIHFAQYDFKLVDLEHRASDDEMLTVVMSMDDALELNEKSYQSLNKEESKPTNKSSQKAKYLNKKNKSKALSEPEIKATDESSPSTPSEDATPSQESNANQQHQGDNKVFVQGAWSDSNRRLNSRREVRWPAVITLKSQQSIQCVTKDISEEGLSLKSPTNIERLALIKVNIKVFHKGRNREITALAVVKHSLVTTGGFIVGIQIKSCSKSSSGFISKFAKREI